MSDRDNLETLRHHLAEAATLEGEPPDLYSGADKTYGAPWTPDLGRTQGSKLASALEAACKRLKMVSPPSLRRQLELQGQMQLSAGLIELAADRSLGTPLPVDDVFELDGSVLKLKRHEEFVLDLHRNAFKRLVGMGIGYVHNGREPARGLIWARAWDEPMLIAATDLQTGAEPVWLAYDPLARDPNKPRRDLPAVVPLGLDFETVLALHLTGIYLAFRMDERALRRLPQVFSRPHAKTLRSTLRWTFQQTKRAATALRDRADVRVPNVCVQREHAIVATLRSVRGAQFFTEDEALQKWLDVTFVGAYPKQPKQAAAVMKAVTEVRAPARPTKVMQGAIADMAGGSHEPAFVKGTVTEVAESLKAAKLAVIVPDANGDVGNYASLADGAAYVLERIKNLEGML